MALIPITSIISCSKTALKFVVAPVYPFGGDYHEFLQHEGWTYKIYLFADEIGQKMLKVSPLQKQKLGKAIVIIKDAKINWQSTTKDSRIILKRLYPSILI